MKHVFIEPKDCNCDKYENGQSCMVCDGGLAICRVCGLMEGSLTTDCPGVESWSEYSERVYKGELDYREGQGWVAEKNPTNQIWEQCHARK